MSARCWWSWAEGGQHPTPHPAQGTSASSLVPQQPAWLQTGQNNHYVPAPKSKSPCFLAWLFPQTEAAVPIPNLGPSHQLSLNCRSTQLQNYKHHPQEGRQSPGSPLFWDGWRFQVVPPPPAVKRVGSATLPVLSQQKLCSKRRG